MNKQEIMILKEMKYNLPVAKKNHHDTAIIAINVIITILLKL